ncbi:Abi-alpha family protein [Parvibaculum sp.]|uniref:Abi-alpha family protein n=1 Tax=Parvibaculum sp. TaxID=2024848 RepID=UPI001B16E078|nr:Abi-alpha family protein [Parvibaculum sp.]MBO6669664.1 DUF4393 domain-containing protein [Parvibaculum sp.]MBO6692697.1 DUF4393 domain-containing protein [Parvibaculum sp.]MBO6716200.1 DUF4393 domain-containing protein [Parvibaculum sp.]
MVAEEQSPVKVDIGLSAKAEVKTEIPKESSGRLLDALTDIIRPFSEQRGLRADQIRLQREDVLLEIARRAKRRLSLEGREPESLPNKFLVPFLEKASLEDIEDEALVNAWANLLSSASSNFDERMVRYVSVLAELGPDQSRFLDALAKNNESGRVRAEWVDAPLLVSDLSIAAYFREKFDNRKAEKYLAAVCENFDVPGSIVIGATLSCGDPDFWDEISPHEDFEQVWGYREIEAVESLSLVRFAASSTFQKDGWSFGIEYVVFTSFGASFYNACTGADRIVEEEIEQELSNIRTMLDQSSDSAGK